MAAFLTMEAADIRSRALMETGAATVAHSQRTKDGVISVRILRPMSLATFNGQDTADGANKSGSWDVLTDDSET